MFVEFVNIFLHDGLVSSVVMEGEMEKSHLQITAAHFPATLAGMQPTTIIHKTYQTYNNAPCPPHNDCQRHTFIYSEPKHSCSTV